MVEVELSDGQQGSSVGEVSVQSAIQGFDAGEGTVHIGGVLATDDVDYGHGLDDTLHNR